MVCKAVFMPRGEQRKAIFGGGTKAKKPNIKVIIKSEYFEEHKQTMKFGRDSLTTLRNSPSEKLTTG